MRFEEAYGLRDGERLKPTERWRRHWCPVSASSTGAHAPGAFRFVVEASGLRIPQAMQKPLRDYEQLARERNHLESSRPSGAPLCRGHAPRSGPYRLDVQRLSLDTSTSKRAAPSNCPTTLQPERLLM